MVKVGLFIPIGNNGWIVSRTSPQYKPTFDLNSEIVQRAEHYGLDFALSMIKLRGYGGETEYWDYNLESFTLMAGIAAVTKKIDLYASVAVLTIPPAIVARMAVTIDSIAPGRFGVNIVSGWAKGEYDQQGLWPGDDYFSYRYDYSSEYVQIMRELWTDGRSDFKGKYFTMNDCRLLPKPSRPIPVVSAGQSERGMRFVADYCDYAFVAGGQAFNQPADAAPAAERLNEAVKGKARKPGLLTLVMVIAAESDEAAMAKWDLYNSGLDMEALQTMGGQGATDANAPKESTGAMIVRNATAARAVIPATLCGSYATVARQLDEIAAIAGVSGIMLMFDDFLKGVEQFGQFIQPLMKSRADVALAA